MSPHSTRLRPRLLYRQRPILCSPSPRSRRSRQRRLRSSPRLRPSPWFRPPHGRCAASAPTEFLPEGAEAVTAGPCADAAPGSHVEAACEGPTEDNPSLSIKKRIKRAQFFDEREQLVAAGMAVPVASDAGLPDAVETPARSTVAVGE